MMVSDCGETHSGSFYHTHRSDPSLVVAGFCERLGCSQSCEKFSNTYRCVCDEEYRLDSDNVSCVERSGSFLTSLSRTDARTHTRRMKRDRNSESRIADTDLGMDIRGRSAKLGSSPILSMFLISIIYQN